MIVSKRFLQYNKLSATITTLFAVTFQISPKNPRSDCIARGCFGECLKASDIAQPVSVDDVRVLLKICLILESGFTLKTGKEFGQYSQNVFAYDLPHEGRVFEQKAVQRTFEKIV